MSAMDPTRQSIPQSHTAILVVDPDERVYKTFGAILGSKYNLVFTPNEELAKLIINDFPFGIVFVGQKSAARSEKFFIHTLKSEHPSIPIIFIAKSPKVDLILTAFRAGVRDIITFPIDPEELIHLTDRIDALRPKEDGAGRFQAASARFNLKSFWSQLRSGSPGYLEIGSEAEQKTSPRVGRTDSNEHSSPGPVSDTRAKGVAASRHPDVRGRAGGSGMCVFFLGQFRAVITDQVLDVWPSRKGKSLFAYLCYHGTKPIFKDALMDVFWPKSMADSARNSLNVLIHGIRKRLQQLDATKEYILFRNECYCINPDIEVWSDVDELKSLWRKAQATEKSQSLEAAVKYHEQIASIYLGDFMPDDLYEDWSNLERENLKEIFLVALEKISENRFRIGNLAEAISLCKAILERDNCREEIYRRLMCCYQRLGRRDKALMVYRKCVQCLKTELDVGPTSSTTELYTKIKTDASNPCDTTTSPTARIIPEAARLAPLKK